MQTIQVSTQQELVIVRGHPGSGKSTFANKFSAHGYSHFENDSFFVDSNGKYTFDIQFHQKAKDVCVENVNTSLALGKSVVVSNTYTKIDEMNDIINFAIENNIPYRIFEMEYEFKNVHDVPEAVVELKKATFEKHPDSVVISNLEGYVVI